MAKHQNVYIPQKLVLFVQHSEPVHYAGTHLKTGLKWD